MVDQFYFPAEDLPSVSATRTKSKYPTKVKTPQNGAARPKGAVQSVCKRYMDYQ